MNKKTQAISPERVPGIEPKTLAFLHVLDSRGGKQLHEMTVERARAELNALQAIAFHKPGVDIEDKIIPVGPKGETAVRIVKPKGSKETLPVIMYFHGGGWALGDRESYDRLLREIATGSNAAVVFVDYTRTPEARYPAAIEEAYAATWWVSENSRSLNINTNHIAVAGDGAGGNMAAVVALLARERKGPRLSLQVLFSPVTDAGFDTPSYELYGNGYFLTRDFMKWSWNHYLPDLPSRKNPTASPLQATIGELEDLPPALIITAEHDPLRDEGEAYAHKLLSAGVTVTATRYLGAIHNFVTLNALADTPASRAALAQANENLRKVLSREKMAEAA